MIHSGAVIAAGISQGRSDTFRKFDLRVSIFMCLHFKLHIVVEIYCLLLCIDCFVLCFETLNSVSYL